MKDEENMEIENKKVIIVTEDKAITVEECRIGEIALKITDKGRIVLTM